MIRFFLLFITIICFSPTTSHAYGDIKVGDTIPHDLTLTDQNGKEQSFKNLTGDKGIVLMFVRSVDWCPYCQKQLLEMNKNAKKFSDWGYTLVSVSYDRVQDFEKFVTNNKPDITLLSDPSSESIRAFGILNDRIAKGTRSYGVPFPGVYVVDKDKKVQAKFFNDGFQDRASARQILVKIEQLNPPEIPPMTMETMGTDPIPLDDAFVEIPQGELPPLIGEDIDVVEQTIQDVETEAEQLEKQPEFEIVPPTIPEIPAPIMDDPNLIIDELNIAPPPSTPTKPDAL